MPTILDKNDFQPSSGTLKKWLSTRKDDNLFVGGNNYPRYFSDLGNSSDSLWFMVAIIGEIVGLITTIAGGVRSGGTFLVFATITVIMFIFCDFFFAVKLHRNKGQKCRINSLIMLGNPADAATIAGLRNELREGKFADFLYQTGIILIAIVKLVGIVLLNVFTGLILYVPFAIIYLIVAYVHLQHTGYYFAYISLENGIKKEHDKWADGTPGLGAKLNSQVLRTQTQLVNVPIRYAPHRIVPHNVGVDNKTKVDNVTFFNYMIETKGVLTDEDIIGLLSGQDPINQQAILKACRNLQLVAFN